MEDVEARFGNTHNKPFDPIYQAICELVLWEIRMDTKTSPAAGVSLRSTRGGHAAG